MTSLLVRFIVPLLIAILLGTLWLHIRRRNGKRLMENLQKEHIVIKFPAVYLVVGCTTVVIFSFLLVLLCCYPNDTVTIWVLLAFGVFDLLGIFLITSTLLWRIDVFREKPFFRYRTVFGKTYYIPYDDCIQCVSKTSGHILKTRTKRIFLDAHAENMPFLLALLSQQIRET